MRPPGAIAVGAALALVLLLGSCWGNNGSAPPPTDEAAAEAQPAAPAGLAAERDLTRSATDVPARQMLVVEAGSSVVPSCSGHGMPCAPRDMAALDLFAAIPLFTPTPGVAFSEPEAPSVEEVLEEGLRVAGSSPVHLALRRTASGPSVRCARRRSVPGWG